MHSRFTLKEVVDFCYENKKRRGFKDWSYEQVATEVCFGKHELTIVCDARGLCGVCLYTIMPDNVFIDHIVTVRGGFQAFKDECLKRFPGKSISGLRDGKLKYFRLYGKFSNTNY